MSHIIKRWVVGGENYCLLQPKIPFHWEQDHTQQCPFPQSKQAVCFKNHHVTEQTLEEISTHFFNLWLFGSIYCRLFIGLQLAMQVNQNAVGHWWRDGYGNRPILPPQTADVHTFSQASLLPDFSLHHIPTPKFSSSILFLHLILHKLTYRSFARDFRKNTISLLHCKFLPHTCTTVTAWSLQAIPLSQRRMEVLAAVPT